MIPLAVDLDGTLTQIDTLHESFVGCLKRWLLAMPHLARELPEGKAEFKRTIAQFIEFDPSNLPYNEPLLEYLRTQHKAGRRLGLFTAADQSVADKVANYVGLFDVVRGSDGLVNLSGARKTQAIREEFGDRFAYAGNSSTDGPVFAAAERAILVGRVARLRRIVPRGADIEAVFPISSPTPHDWFRALRVHHWVKNALVFLAPGLAIQFASLGIAAEAFILFIAMNMLTSATYLINDLFDLAADRAHSSKRFRPIAAGIISVYQGAVAAAGLILASLLLGLLLPWAALGGMIVYLVLTLAYSLVFKHQPMIDVMVLASLFTLRVLVGGLILPAPVSPWLLTFSMLFFLGLAMVKRYAEIYRNAASVAARGYTERDLSLILSTGIASSMGAIVIFMIYMVTEQYPRAIYNHPSFLWATMPLILTWTLRLWHLTVHGRIDDDPVVFALKDRFSLGVGVAVAIVLIAAWS